LQNVLTGLGFYPEVALMNSKKHRPAVSRKFGLQDDGIIPEVPGRAVFTGQEPRPLLQVIRDCWADGVSAMASGAARGARRHIQLIAAGGYGKTTHLLDVWRKFDENSAEIIPMFMSLSTCNEDERDFIQKEIVRLYIEDSHIIDNNKWELMRSKLCDLLCDVRSGARFLLMLDGINETIVSSTLLNEVNVLSHYANLQIVLATRYGFSEFQLWSKASLLPLDCDFVKREVEALGGPAPSGMLADMLRIPFYFKLFTLMYNGNDRLTGSPADFRAPGELLKEYSSWVVDRHMQNRAPRPGYGALRQIPRYLADVFLPSFAADCLTKNKSSFGESDIIDYLNTNV